MALVRRAHVDDAGSFKDWASNFDQFLKLPRCIAGIGQETDWGFRFDYLRKQPAEVRTAFAMNVSGQALLEAL